MFFTNSQRASKAALAAQGAKKPGSGGGSLSVEIGTSPETAAVNPADGSVTAEVSVKQPAQQPGHAKRETNTRQSEPPIKTQSSRRNKALAEIWQRSRSGFIVLAVLTVFSNVLKLSVPIYILQVLDRVISSRSVDTLIMLSLIAAFAILVAIVIDFTRRWMLVRWSVHLEDRLSADLFKYGFQRKRPRAPARALWDVGEVSSFTSSGGAIAWLDVGFVPVFLLVVFVIEPTLAALVAAGMVLMVAIGYIGEISTRSSREGAKVAKAITSDWALAASGNPQSVAALNVSSRIARRWHKSARLRNEENTTTRLFVIGVADSLRLIENLVRVGCYLLGIWLVIAGSLTVGSVIAAAIIGRIANSTLRKAMANWRDLALATSALKRTTRRLSQIETRQPVIRDRKAKLSLTFEGVTVRNRGQARAVVRDLSFTLEPGTILNVIGPSGSGKTTLAKLAVGAAIPSSGSVRLGEVDVNRYLENERENLIGFLDQGHVLFRTSILENITGLRRAKEADAVAAAKQANLHEIVMRLPEGYQTRIDPSDTSMSMGELKRITMARAFFGTPRLIVLDEPEANLDELTVRRISKSILAHRELGATIIVTSQTDTFVNLADRVLLLGPTSRTYLFDSREAYRAHAINKRRQLPQDNGPANDGLKPATGGETTTSESAA